ncbi:LuxR C-terminal-related transcriptional regulator [Nocardia arizonensis]|uniref:LuxR C-terminal-related transcriptional regulator n=1 Tax=Nocardia arizonensis TaxID=1141647 RepID=UPI0006D108D0|nr:LuxR C-terminal-related transcriptional regulator [Nocardia arizonensis]
MNLDIDSPTAQALVRRAVVRLRACTDVPLAFGGIRTGDQIPITAVEGGTSPQLRTLMIRAGRGLGGQAWLRRSPQFVDDYGTARTITHDYDKQILAEGIGALAAAPVIIDGNLTGLIYAGTRERRPLPDRLLSALYREGLRISTELAFHTGERHGSDCSADAESIELANLRRFYADIRQVVSTSPDDQLRSGIRRILDLSFAPRTTTVLTPRQLDVLALAAVGLRNAAIAERLGLAPATVKSYLRAAMNRLGTHSRHEAVSRARELGLIG